MKPAGINSLHGLLLAWILAGAAHGSTNGLALVPPMGWNSWYCFYGNYNEGVIRGVADAMTTNGLQAAGYQYINLDDCYATGRDTAGFLVVDTNKFPGGLAALGAYLHSKGFKFGVYAIASTWPGYCGGPPSYGFETNDVLSIASWGADFLKIDGLGGLGPNVTESAQTVATRWADLLRACGRPVVLSLCGGSFEGWYPRVGNLFRVSLDITQDWRGVTNNLEILHRSALFTGPGGWNDPDMLFIGNNTNLTETESRAYFSLWCITASPLLLSSDVRTLTATTKAIVTAPELIAVDQDPLGASGLRVSSVAANGGNLEVWSKPLSDPHARAVALFNRSSGAADLTVSWSNLVLQAGPATVRDLWARAELGTFTNSFTTNVPSHGAVVLKIVGTP